MGTGSCLTKVLEAFEKLYGKIDEEKRVYIVYLNISKAFGKIPHVKLIKKWQACGI